MLTLHWKSEDIEIAVRWASQAYKFILVLFKVHSLDGPVMDLPAVFQSMSVFKKVDANNVSVVCKCADSVYELPEILRVNQVNIDVS